MSRERLEREQMLKAQTDLLTGALNRHAFEAYGERLIARHEAAGKPLCLVVIDLDQLKSLNDRFGHAGGDAILVQFAAIARENIRPDNDGTVDLKELESPAGQELLKLSYK